MFTVVPMLISVSESQSCVLTGESLVERVSRYQWLAGRNEDELEGKDEILQSKSLHDLLLKCHGQNIGLLFLFPILL